MESNNSSSNTATASSSDPPPPNQRNGDKGKQTCSSNKSEVNENKNNNPESSVLKAENKGKSSSYYDGFVYMDDNDDLKLLPDECYSEPLIMEHLVSGNDDSLNDFKGLDSTEDVQMSFADYKEEPPQPSGGSSSQQLSQRIEAENQTVANSEGLFGYSEPLVNKPLMEHLVSGNDSFNDFKDLDSTEDVEKSFADEDPAGGSNHTHK